MSDRFMKAIRYDEVRVGDVVAVLEDEPQLIEQVHKHNDGAYTLVGVDGEWIRRARADHIIGLVHRPWPKGEDTLSFVRAKVFQAEKGFERRDDSVDLEIKIEFLLRAVEAYKLGKPLGLSVVPAGSAGETPATEPEWPGGR